MQPPGSAGEPVDVFQQPLVHAVVLPDPTRSLLHFDVVAEFYDENL
jgi:hypothetical protein